MTSTPRLALRLASSRSLGSLIFAASMRSPRVVAVTPNGAAIASLGAHICTAMALNATAITVKTALVYLSIGYPSLFFPSFGLVLVGQLVDVASEPRRESC